MLVLHVSLYAFGAELAFVERKVFPRFKTDDLIVFDLQINAALLPAEATVGWD